MTKQEAQDAWQMIATVYDLHPERAGEQATVWVPMLERQELDIAVGIVSGWVDGQQPDRLPHVGIFAGMCRSARRRIHESGSHRFAKCKVCLDDGIVEVGRRFYTFQGRRVEGSEQMAPCPACEKGGKLEHPESGAGAFGPDGFWCGQGWDAVGNGVVQIRTPA